MGRLRALAVVVSCLWSVITLAGGAATTQRFDATTPLESRITDTPASVLKMFADAGEPAPTPHVLTADERRTLAAAFAALPPLHRTILLERLQSLSFLDGMPNTALTSPVNPGELVTRYHWTIRAGVLHETVSDWLTAKERTLFGTEASPLTVSVEAGTMDAILYVLLHEGAHVVDGALGLTPAMPRGGSETPGRSTPFTAGVWTDRLVPVAAYRDPLIEQVTFRRGGKPLRLDQARPLYVALQRTPFVSVYASTNWYDDLAETLSVYHLTARLKQPFRIVVRDGGREVFACEPAKSALVRRRFDQLSRFYETAGP
jgi:hypothetical protein